MRCVNCSQASINRDLSAHHNRAGADLRPWHPRTRNSSHRRSCPPTSLGPREDRGIVVDLGIVSPFKPPTYAMLPRPACSGLPYPVTKVRQARPTSKLRRHVPTVALSAGVSTDDYYDDLEGSLIDWGLEESSTHTRSQKTSGPSSSSPPKPPMLYWPDTPISPECSRSWTPMK